MPRWWYKGLAYENDIKSHVFSYDLIMFSVTNLKRTVQYFCYMFLRKINVGKEFLSCTFAFSITNLARFIWEVLYDLNIPVVDISWHLTVSIWVFIALTYQ